MTISDYIDLIKTVRKRQEGQTMAEYAVVLGVIHPRRRRRVHGPRGRYLWRDQQRQGRDLSGNECDSGWVPGNRAHPSHLKEKRTRSEAR
jgi:hypothetical protein